MRTNKTLRIASVLLIAVLMTTCVIGGTFAKYTSTATATAKASVATWEVTVENQDIDAGTADIIEFNILDTAAKATDTDSGDADGDDHVAAGKIAPGTKGEFAFVLNNASEVAAQATIVLSNDLPTNVELKYNDAAIVGNTITVDLPMQAENVVVTITWEWAFETGADESEIAVGDAADLADEGTTMTVSAAMTFVQVD